MKTGRFLLLTIILLFPSLSSTEDSSPIIRVKGKGKSSTEITTASKARALALRAATIDAYRKLARAAGIENKTKLGSMEYSQIKAFLTGAVIEKKIFISDHEAEVTMTIPFENVISILANNKNSNLNELHIRKLKEKVIFIESEVMKLQSELKMIKRILDKLEEKKN